MTKTSIRIFFCFLTLSGCASPRYNYSPSLVQIDEPSSNHVTTAYVGDTIIQKGYYKEADALYLSQEVKVGAFGSYVFTPGYYFKQGDSAGSEYYLPSNREGSGRVIVKSLADPFQVIHLKTKSGKLCGVSVFNLEMCAKTQAFEKKKYVISDSESFKKLLIYSGKIGNKINVGYREFEGDLARPAFSNEVEYDLAESKIIGYKGARIEIMEATNEYIKYKVISKFK